MYAHLHTYIFSAPINNFRLNIHPGAPPYHCEYTKRKKKKRTENSSKFYYKYAQKLQRFVPHVHTIQGTTNMWARLKFNVPYFLFTSVINRIYSLRRSTIVLPKKAKLAYQTEFFFLFIVRRKQIMPDSFVE